MNTEDFRREIGISQILLADWLGISRDLLAQYETNRREIPTKSLLILGQLQRLLDNIPDAMPATEEPITFQKRERSIRTKIHILDQELLNLRYKLALLEKRIKIWNKALSLCRKLEAEPIFENEITKKALQLFHLKTWVAWNEQGPRERRILQFYNKQKTEEKTFLEQLANDFAIGNLG